MTATTLRTPTPPPPRWAEPFINQPLTRVFPKTSSDCLGNIDAVDQRYDGDPVGVTLAGWGWNSRAGAPFQRLLVTNADGFIAGAGTANIPRPDAQQAFPSTVTAPNAGFAIPAIVAEGEVSVYGVMDATTVCLLRSGFSL